MSRVRNSNFIFLQPVSVKDSIARGAGSGAGRGKGATNGVAMVQAGAKVQPVV